MSDILRQIGIAEAGMAPKKDIIMIQEEATTQQCINHPFRRQNPSSGICPLCLQEKLGKLVSSSPLFLSINPPPSLSSSPPSSAPTNPIHQQYPPKSSFKNSFWSPLIPSTFRNNRRSPFFSASRNPLADLSKIPTRCEHHKADAETSGSPTVSQATSSFGRKVARSRSVGCGSRSFSADFLDRISNGFGDCTLRRVESRREPKSEEQIDKERVKCGSMFVGLGISSSIYDACNESCDLARGRSRGGHGRNKSWSWVLASPMRVFRHGGVSGHTQ